MSPLAGETLRNRVCANAVSETERVALPMPLVAFVKVIVSP